MLIRQGDGRRHSRQDRLEALADSIYDAAVAHTPWDHVASLLVSEFDGTSMLSSIQDWHSGHVDAVAQHNMLGQPFADYAAHWHQEDVWARAAGRRQVALTAFTGEELVPLRDYMNTSFYFDYMRPSLGGVCYAVGSVFSLEGPLRGQIGIHRPKAAGDFELEDRAALEYLLPHLRRGMQLRRRLAEAKARQDAERQALDGLAMGALLLDRHGRVLFANQAAEGLLRQADGLFLGQYRVLLAARAEETTRLYRLIGGASLPGGGGAMRLSRASGKLPLEAIVIPVRRRNSENLPSEAAAILYLSDPAAKPRPAQENLRALLGLTPAETELALHLLAGATLEQVAALRGVSRETIRTQLKELFRKTDTVRQSDLLRYLANCLAVLTRQDERPV